MSNSVVMVLANLVVPICLDFHTRVLQKETDKVRCKVNANAIAIRGLLVLFLALTAFKS